MLKDLWNFDSMPFPVSKQVGLQQYILHMKYLNTVRFVALGISSNYIRLMICAPFTMIVGNVLNIAIVFLHLPPNPR